VNLDKVDDTTANKLRKSYGIEELDPNRVKDDDEGVKSGEDMDELD